MQRFLACACATAALVLGSGLAVGVQPASAETVIVKRVKGVCYDRDGERVPCTGRYRTHRHEHYYRDRREPGVSVEIDTHKRRHHRHSDWD